MKNTMYDPQIQEIELQEIKAIVTKPATNFVLPVLNENYFSAPKNVIDKGDEDYKLVEHSLSDKACNVAATFMTMENIKATMNCYDVFKNVSVASATSMFIYTNPILSTVGAACIATSYAADRYYGDSNNTITKRATGMVVSAAAAMYVPLTASFSLCNMIGFASLASLCSSTTQNMTRGLTVAVSGVDLPKSIGIHAIFASGIAAKVSAYFSKDALSNNYYDKLSNYFIYKGQDVVGDLAINLGFSHYVAISNNFTTKMLGFVENAKCLFTFAATKIDPAYDYVFVNHAPEAKANVQVNESAPAVPQIGYWVSRLLNEKSTSLIRNMASI